MQILHPCLVGSGRLTQRILTLQSIFSWLFQFLHIQPVIISFVDNIILLAFASLSQELKSLAGSPFADFVTLVCIGS